MIDNVKKNYILFFRHTGIISILLIVLFSGCRAKTPPVSFYTLAPLQEASTPKNPESSQNISIGIGPVSLPDFLNKPQIVTRKGVSKIQYSEFNRWGGYLDKAFLRVVSENLSVLLSTDQVKIFPWGGKTEPLYQVDFDVKQFDGNLGDNAELNVIWRISVTDKNSNPVITKRSFIQETVSGSDHNALVAAYNRILNKLSQEIAKGILYISDRDNQSE